MKNSSYWVSKVAWNSFHHLSKFERSSHNCCHRRGTSAPCRRQRCGRQLGQDSSLSCLVVKFGATCMNVYSQFPQLRDLAIVWGLAPTRNQQIHFRCLNRHRCTFCPQRWSLSGNCVALACCHVCGVQTSSAGWQSFDEVWRELNPWRLARVSLLEAWAVTTGQPYLNVLFNY